MPTTTQPLDLLDAKITIPSEMRSAEWSRLDQWTRERAFYMAGVADAEIAQEMREIVQQAATGDAGEFELRQQWEAHLDKVGYQPLPGQEGTIKDLRSLRRFNAALRTNLSLMHEWARKENALRPGPVAAQPSFELVRLAEARVPRDWPARFVAAGGTLYDGRMIAPKLDDVWRALGSTDLFPDSLGVDYPPYAWGSGMGRLGVGARETVSLGVMTREEIVAQADAVRGRPITSPSATMETTPRVTDPDLRDDLATRLDGLARWDGDALVFTDPNGTRRTTEAELVETWSRPLPEPFRTEDHPAGLFQRDSVLLLADEPEAFAARPDTDAWDDLARALMRLHPRKDHRRILAGIADREDVSWIDRLTGSSLWSTAMEITQAAPRAVEILKLIRSIF
jgi:hypothetical protein